MGHGHHAHGHSGQPQVLPRDKEKVAKIIRTTIILGILTGIEFILAFTVDRGNLLTSIFVFLTLVKAYFIVAEFMHLKYEVKMLILSVVLPMMFIVWFIVSMLTEGNAILNLREWVNAFGA